MGKEGLLRAGFLVAFVLTLTLSAAQAPPPSALPRSVPDGEYDDLRHCDPDWNRPVDIRPSNDADEADVRAYDRDWCNATDFSTANPTEPAMVLSLKDFPAEAFDFRG